MKFLHSFSARLSVVILLITSCLFIASITVVSLSSHRLIGTEATKSASNVLKATILDIEKTLGTVETSVRNMVWLIKEHSRDTNYVYHITEKTVEENPYIIGSAIAFEPYYFPGKYYCSPFSFSSGDEVVSKQLGGPDYDYLTMDWYQIPKLLKKACWSEPYFDEGGSEREMSTYSIPLYDRSGKIYGVVTADISLEWLRKKILSIKPYTNSYTILIGRSGAYISHYDESKILNETIFTTAVSSEDSTTAILGKEMLAGHSGVLSFKNKSTNAFVVYGHLSNGWSAAIICPYKDVFARTMKMNIVIILVSAFGLFALFILCLTAIRRLTKPITEFSQSALEMAKGDLKTKLPVIKSKDEMKQLHDSFEYMQKSLTDYIDKLKTTTAANERFVSELNIARSIQMDMVPQIFPDRKDLDLYAIMKPAKEVGGDLYDFFIRDGILYYAIGDVSGKGVPAALFMAITRAAFRCITTIDLSMAKIVSMINDYVSDGNDNNMFVTFFAGTINLTTREMHWCNAGHNPIVIISPSGKAEYIQSRPNLAAGLFNGFKYEDESMTLERGSRLVLYTDGVTEAENAKKDFFGEDRLIEWAGNTASSEPSKEAIEQLMKKITNFTAGNEQNDDITIMSIDIK